MVVKNLEPCEMVKFAMMMQLETTAKKSTIVVKCFLVHKLIPRWKFARRWSHSHRYSMNEKRIACMLGLQIPSPTYVRICTKQINFFSTLPSTWLLKLYVQLFAICDGTSITNNSLCPSPLEVCPTSYFTRWALVLKASRHVFIYE